MRLAQVSKAFAALVLLPLVLSLVAIADKDSKKKLPPINKDSRFTLIRELNAERVHARRYFPMGKKSLTMKPDGTVVPDGLELQGLIAQHGAAARPGERVKITDMKIEKRKIVFEINGGPRKSKKWYERVEIGSVGGSAAPLDRGDSKEEAKGSALTIEFEDYVPDMTVAQVKEMLKPVLDFTSISPLQAYLEVIPAVVKEAIKNHEVLVGMDGEMVRHAKGRPPRKIREKDGDVAYEEWLYGNPPEDVLFIRLVKDRVVQVKTAKITGEITVATARVAEIDDYFVKQGVAAAEQPRPAPMKVPTLKRPGEDAGPNPPAVIYPPVPYCKEGQTQNCKHTPPDIEPQTRPE
ncbi:MAG: hypothetical protein Q7R94_01335 [bacterium]|nr:hypothetical protein [bacterium]